MALFMLLDLRFNLSVGDNVDLIDGFMGDRGHKSSGNGWVIVDIDDDRARLLPHPDAHCVRWWPVQRPLRDLAPCRFKAMRRADVPALLQEYEG